MIRSMIWSGLALALGAFVLTWIEYQYLARSFPGEIYIVLIAIAFTVLGIWAGHHLTAIRRGRLFTRNDAAVQSIGLTPRELAVLERLATGETNKQIARQFGTSPNTVKTQVASILAKLQASTRTAAIQRARELSLIP